MVRSHERGLALVASTMRGPQDERQGFDGARVVEGRGEGRPAAVNRALEVETRIGLSSPCPSFEGAVGQSRKADGIAVDARCSHERRGQIGRLGRPWIEPLTEQEPR